MQLWRGRSASRWLSRQYIFEYIRSSISKQASQKKRSSEGVDHDVDFPDNKFEYIRSSISKQASQKNRSSEGVDLYLMVNFSLFFGCPLFQVGGIGLSSKSHGKQSPISEVSSSLLVVPCHIFCFRVLWFFLLLLNYEVSHYFFFFFFFEKWIWRVNGS